MIIATTEPGIIALLVSAIGVLGGVISFLFVKYHNANKRLNKQLVEGEKEHRKDIQKVVREFRKFLTDILDDVSDDQEAVVRAITASNERAKQVIKSQEKLQLSLDNLRIEIIRGNNHDRK